MKRNRFLTALFAAVALTAVAGCSDSGGEATSGAGEGEVKSITLIAASSVPSITTEVAVYAVPLKMGFFEEEGLNVEMIGADGSTAAIQALASGSGNVSFPEGSTVVAASEKGIPVQGFAGLVEKWQWQMAVPPGSDVTSIADLKGKKIGVISLASGSYLFAKAAMKAAGLDPMNDAEYVPVGFGAPAAEAMDKGEVDAIALYSTLYEQLSFEGYEFNYLENPALFNDLPGLVWAAPSSSLSSDPAALAAFARAAYKGVIFTLANPEAAVKIAYEVWPDLKPEASKAAAQLDADVVALLTEVGSYVQNKDDQSTWTNWGQMEEKALTNLVDYAYDSELITEKIESDTFWDSSIVPQIGEIDVAPIVELAQSQ